MSVTLGGAISSLIFGSVAAVGSAVSSVTSRVFVEPAVIVSLAGVGAPLLLGSTYDDILMEKDVCAPSLDDKLRALYVESSLATLMEVNPEMAALAEKLEGAGLNSEESLTIASALGTPHDKLFLLRSKARRIAKSLRLNPVSPLGVTVDAFRRRIIKLDEFVRLASYYVLPDSGR